MKDINLSVRLGKIRLKNPVMVASGTFGHAEEFGRFVDLKRLGAIVTKTVTLRPRNGNPMPRICETIGGLLNSIGLQNDGIDDFISKKIPYLRKIGIPIIVSIAGEDTGEFNILAKRLDAVREVSGIELNISCPNLERYGRHRKREFLIAQDERATYKVVKNVRMATDKTLITKLSPDVTDITKIAHSAIRGGTDILSLVNTFSGMAIDVENRKPLLGNIIGGLSGPCIKPLALRMVWEVYRNFDVPVIGIGGIMNANDAIEFMLAGATGVQIGTANLVDPAICEQIIDGMKDYLKRHRLDDINSIIGALDISPWRPRYKNR